MAENLRQINSIGIKTCATGLPMKNKDFLLINSSKTPVKSSVLDGKLLGILIGPHWLIIPLQHALSVLCQSNEELRKAGKEVVFVYVAADRDEEVIKSLKRYGQENQIDGTSDMECFERVLGILPKDWLVVPFEPSDVRSELINSYRSGIFSLAFVGSDGKLHTKDGLKMLEKWGVDAYPFTEERVQQLQREALDLASNQCIKSLLTTDARDFLITPDGTEVDI